jgi:Arginine-tRNA-protein transferase, N terminus
MAAIALTPEAYQDLLHCGWRRSGTYLYQPCVDQQCCPHHTIRLDVTQFSPSSSHKRALRRFRLFQRGKWAERERHKRQQAAAQGGADGGADAAARQTSASGGADAQGHQARSSGLTPEDMAARCSGVLRTALQAAAAGSPAAAACNAKIAFTVQSRNVTGPRAKRADTGTRQSDAEAPAIWAHASKGIAARVTLRCSLCWEVAARQAAAAAGSVAAARGLSKSASKRLRKRKQHRRSDESDGYEKPESVSVAATALANEAILPLLSAAIHADEVLRALQPECSAERGHLCVQLDLLRGSSAVDGGVGRTAA